MKGASLPCPLCSNDKKPGEGRRAAIGPTNPPSCANLDPAVDSGDLCACRPPIAVSRAKHNPERSCSKHRLRVGDTDER
jgi:hypothetical protein